MVVTAVVAKPRPPLLLLFVLLIFSGRFCCAHFSPFRSAGLGFGVGWLTRWTATGQEKITENGGPLLHLLGQNDRTETMAFPRALKFQLPQFVSCALLVLLNRTCDAFVLSQSTAKTTALRLSPLPKGISPFEKSLSKGVDVQVTSCPNYLAL